VVRCHHRWVTNNSILTVDCSIGVSVLDKPSGKVMRRSRRASFGTRITGLIPKTELLSSKYLARFKKPIGECRGYAARFEQFKKTALRSLRSGKFNCTLQVQKSSLSSSWPILQTPSVYDCCKVEPFPASANGKPSCRTCHIIKQQKAPFLLQNLFFR